MRPFYCFRGAPSNSSKRMGRLVIWGGRGTQRRPDWAWLAAPCTLSRSLQGPGCVAKRGGGTGGRRLIPPGLPRLPGPASGPFLLTLSGTLALGLVCQ